MAWNPPQTRQTAACWMEEPLGTSWAGLTEEHIPPTGT